MKVLMKILRFWPFLLSTIIICLNKEIIVMPFLNALNFPTLSIFLIYGFWGTMDLFWWFWFKNWIYRLIIGNKIIMDFINNVNKDSIKEPAKDTLRAIINFFIERVKKENYDKKFKFFKKFGRNTAIFLTGIIPGGIEVGILICRSGKWNDKIIFITANLIKIASFTGLW